MGNRDPLSAGARRAIYLLGIALVVLAAIFLSRHAYEADRPLQVAKSSGEQATVLFGAASLALLLFSILFALVPMLGWEMIQKRIHEAVRVRLQMVENELRGRIFAAIGYVVGESSLTDDGLGAINVERLREAVFNCQQGYDLLRKVGGPGEFMALNNLVEYSCVLGENFRRGYLLESAGRLRVAGEAHDVPNLLLTYCRAILTFGLEPGEIDEACAMVEDLQSNPRLSAREKREAEFLASLCARRSPLRLPHS